MSDLMSKRGISDVDLDQMAASYEGGSFGPGACGKAPERLEP